MKQASADTLRGARSDGRILRAGRTGQSPAWLYLVIAAMLAAPHSFGQAKKTSTSRPQALTLQVYTADDDGYDVNSTLILGRTEAILVDAQFRLKDEVKLADQITATGRNLKAILITHPDDDHYAGLAVLQKRFPRARIYMAPTALDEFRRTVADSLAGMKKRYPSETPDSLPAPEVLPSEGLTIDGQRMEVVADLQGDYMEKPANSFLWIPSLRAIIAGDLVFNGVHPWLAGSTEKTRADWRRSLQRIAALHPRIVVAGHKKTSDLPDSPDSVAFMTRYLSDFDAASKAAHDADELAAAMKRKYPDLAQERFLAYAAKAAFAR